MNLYYTGVALLILAALLFVTLPILWSRRFASNHDNSVSNPEIVKQRLTELSCERQEALLSESDYQDAILEVKLSLADEMESTSTGVARTGRTGKVLLSLVAVVIVGIALLVYQQVNNLAELNRWQQVNSQLSDLGQRIVVESDNSITRDELVDFSLALRTKLSREASDPMGWLLLGRVLSTLRDFQGAIQAFDKSLAIEPDKPGTLFSAAQTLLVTNDAVNIQRAEGMLLKLRQLTPTDTNVEGLLAVVYTRQGRNEQAANTWRALKSRLASNDPLQSTIDQQLSALGLELPPEAASTELLVNVTLSMGVADKLPDSGYLFVFVQDSDSGMKMPAAVKKLPLADIDLSAGLSISLTNSDAMLQDYNLSKLQNGRLIARISQDQNVAVQNGDLQGELLIPLAHGERTEYKLIIDKELM